MNGAPPDARVRGWESALPCVPNIRDANDRHVVAAALVGRADVIVTFNLKDFVTARLPGDLFSQSPDEFLLDLLDPYPMPVRDALEEVASRTGRKGPRWTLEDLLVRLEREGCCRFVSAAHQSMGAPSWRKNREIDLLKGLIISLGGSRNGSRREVIGQ